MKTGSRGLSTAAGLLAILLWSGTFALARSLSEQLGPFTTGAAVYLTGGVLSLIPFWTRRRAGRWTTPPTRYLVGCGSLFIFYSGAIYLAVGLAADRTQLLQVALINYLWPALTIGLSLPLMGNRAKLWLLPATLAALAGVVMVVTDGSGFAPGLLWERLGANPPAYLLALAAAVAWGLYSNLARRWSGAGHQGAVELFVPATGLALLALRLIRPETAHWNAVVAIEILVLGLITAVAYFLWEHAMRRGHLVPVVAASYVTPLLSTVVSCVYLKVSPGASFWAGCSLLVAGSLLSWLSITPAAAPQNETGRN